MVPAQKPGLSSGSLNNLHLKGIVMGVLTFNIKLHYISSRLSSGQNTGRRVRKENILFQTKCF